jgi:membrane associated rhomboid family serine protease
MGGNVAYWAHIVGFVAGMIMGLIVKKRKTKPEIYLQEENSYLRLDITGFCA